MKFDSQKFDALLQDTSTLRDYIDTPYIVSGGETFESEDELRDYLQERIHEAEVIYYTAAMDYLRENDPSLTDALALAHEYGYTADKLNSELLATLLLQQNLSSELAEMDLDECFSEDESEAAND